jgi:hypothetical protein
MYLDQISLRREFHHIGMGFTYPERFAINSMTVRSNQNRPDFADAEKLFLLFKYPWGPGP